MDLQSDPEKTLYEEKFFHRPEYIIARAQRLAELLKELNIDSSIIISIIAYFKNESDIKSLSDEYQVSIMPNMKVDDYITARIDIKTINNEYMIETKIRDVLLNLLISQGQFVRISVYY